MTSTTPLCKLALRYKSDKCPQRGKHTYTPFYYHLFKDKRNVIKKVLEIGIGRGGSLLMWQDFFPQAQIYGVDYRPDLLLNRDRIKSFLIDQRRKEHLRQLIEHTGPGIDLVVDDGSHRPRDQVFTCLTLMPLLNKDVTYIIEDVADPAIVRRFSGYDVEVPKIDQTIKRYDNCLIIVRHKASPSREIIFYTDNQLSDKIAGVVQDQLTKISADLAIPIICSSLSPMPHFGTTNICFPHLARSHRAMFLQTLAALEASSAEIIFFCEHDVLYHPSHFDFVPPKKDTFYYNRNWWMLRLIDGHAITYDACKLSTLCAYRELLLKEYRKRHRAAEENHYRHNFWYEPGTHENNFAIWKSTYPVIDVRHDRNLTYSYWKQNRFRDKNTCQNWVETDDEIPGWGKTQDITAKLK